MCGTHPVTQGARGPRRWRRRRLDLRRLDLRESVGSAQDPLAHLQEYPHVRDRARRRRVGHGGAQTQGQGQAQAHRAEGRRDLRGAARAGHRARRSPTPTATSAATSPPPTSTRRSSSRRWRRRSSGPQEPLNILVMGSDTRDWRGQRHRQPDRPRPALRHHDPHPPLGRPEARLRHQHPARLPGHPSRLQGRGRRDRPGRHRRDVERGLQPRRVPAARSPSSSRSPASASTTTSWWTSQGFQDMVDAVDGVQVCIPEDHRRPRARDLPPGRHPRDQREGGAQLRAAAVRRRRRLRHRPDQASAGLHVRDGQQGRLRRHAGQPGHAGPVPRRGDQVADGRLGSGEPVQARASSGYQFKDIGLAKIQFSTIPWEYTAGPQPRRVGRARRRRTSGTGSRTTSRSRRGRPATPSRPGTCPARPRARPSSASGSGGPTKSPTATPSGDARRGGGRRRALHMTEPRTPATAPPTRPSGSASAGSPRSSGTCSPTPPPTSASPARARPTTAGDEWLRAQVPPHHG